MILKRYVGATTWQRDVVYCGYVLLADFFNPDKFNLPHSLTSQVLKVLKTTGKTSEVIHCQILCKHGLILKSDCPARFIFLHYHIMLLITKSCSQ